MAASLRAEFISRWAFFEQTYTEMGDGNVPAGFGALVVDGALAGVPPEQADTAIPAATTRARALPRTGRG